MNFEYLLSDEFKELSHEEKIKAVEELVTKVENGELKDNEMPRLFCVEEHSPDNRLSFEEIIKDLGKEKVVNLLVEATEKARIVSNINISDKNIEQFLTKKPEFVTNEVFHSVVEKLKAFKEKNFAVNNEKYEEINKVVESKLQELDTKFSNILYKQNEYADCMEFGELISCHMFYLKKDGSIKEDSEEEYNESYKQIKEMITKDNSIVDRYITWTELDKDNADILKNYFTD